ncbi:hypothetical protein EC973_006314 [Apophysomyces ossiformis]|uniref:SET domain-containing protein n=1 Tax=Apophysomyces ossiformis TaxID=679940 RepID=A0A8H7BEN0_9FUNG|nr:hypothetical protein EC973_006314 [Apophysomyces ossiformis]
MDSFLRWAKDSGILASAVKVVKTPNAGYGLFATRNINPDEVVLHIPRDMLITASRVLQYPHMKAFHGNSDRVIICIFLAHERFIASNSVWKPYMDCLPSDESYRRDHTLYNAQWVAGTSLAAAISAKLTKLKREHASLQLDWLTLDMWIWADVTFWSRVVELGNNELTLVPFFDFANHSLSPNIRWEQGIGVDLLPFGEAIAANTELTLSYGAKSNQELLFLHGFCIPHNPQSSVLTLPVQPFLDEPEKFAWLSQAGSLVLKLGRSGWANDTFRTMYLAALDEDDGLRWEGDQLYLGLKRISSPEALMENVIALDHYQVIELRVILLLLEAVQYHYQELAKAPTMQDGAIKEYIDLYKQEEKTILEHAIEELEDKRNKLLEHNVVINYLSNAS